MTSDENSRVGIVGGSLAGLTTALLLREAGNEVEIFERSGVDRASHGAGMAVHEPTIRYSVERLGIDLDEITVSTRWQRFLGAQGEVLHESEGTTFFTTWATLYNVLLDAYGLDSYRTGAKVVGATYEGGAATSSLLFEDGERREFDLVVGADGVQSTLRSKLLPAARFRRAGYVGWRGVVGRAALGAELFDQFADAVTYFIGDHTHIVTYPVPSQLETGAIAAEPHLNFVWYRNFDDERHLESLLTDRDGDLRTVSVPKGAVSEQNIERLRADAEALLAPQFAALVGATAEPFIQLIGDLTATRLVFGRVALIGDAAFVARPHPAAGAAKASEDAWTLAQAVAGPREESALRLWRWERSRLAAGEHLVQLAQTQGEQVQRDGTWSAGKTFFSFDLFEFNERLSAHASKSPRDETT